MTTMASKSRQKRSDLVWLGFLFAAGLLGQVESAESRNLLRKRVDEEALEQIASLEGLWDHIAATAQLTSESQHVFKEYERGLQGMSMSMPLEPTKSPTPSPTSPPTTTPGPTATPEPSPAPVIPTRRPTTSPTSNLTILPTRRPTPRPTPRPTRAPSRPTPRPTVGSTVDCLEDPKGYILGLLTPITDEAILLDPTTPQGRAYLFLINDDYLSNPCGKTVEQRYGLVTLYYATNGNSWTNNQRWLLPANECLWTGVTCNEDGLVTELQLGKSTTVHCFPYLMNCDSMSNTFWRSFETAINGLDGEIPNEISTLVALIEFDIFANSIRGTIPAGFSQLMNLEVLDMQENLLSGQAFPPSVLALRRLESYRINSNALTGPVPSRIGSLRSLEELWAAGNDITGSLPTEMGNLRDLKTVLLYENQLQGELPSELGLIPLEGLWLWGNFFRGTIPSQLFNVASLKTIRMENNFFFGELPSQIGQITDLQDLRLDNNNLSGQIPSQIAFLTDLGKFFLGKECNNGKVLELNKVCFCDL
jgi:hypothetical protein